jgi:hypothetical protein
MNIIIGVYSLLVRVKNYKLRTCRRQEEYLSVCYEYNLIFGTVRINFPFLINFGCRLF